MRLEGKVAIVTGAASGIGRAVALRFAREGARVVCCDINDEGGNDTQREIGGSGGMAVFVKTDVTRSDETARMAQTALDKFGSIEILVPAAGVNDVYAGTLDITEAQWDRNLAINLKGVFLCCRSVLPIMVRQGHGMIVTISSAATIGWPPLYPAYTAAKMGVMGLTQCMAREFQTHGVGFLIFRPGYVDTPMGRQSFIDQEHRDMTTKDTGVMKPEEAAGIILNMVDGEMLYASGSIVNTMRS
jgi:NAD(P)-dependent dehydrogenase (short-subunit alcohol dehydrogenase family)